MVTRPARLSGPVYSICASGSSTRPCASMGNSSCRAARCRSGVRGPSVVYRLTDALRCATVPLSSPSGPDPTQPARMHGRPTACPRRFRRCQLRIDCSQTTGHSVGRSCPGSGGRSNSTVLKGFFAPPIPLDNRLARATGSRQRGFLISPIPRESEATEGRGRQEIPELLRTQRKVEVRFSDVRDLPGFPPGFSNRGSCGGGC